MTVVLVLLFFAGRVFLTFNNTLVFVVIGTIRAWEREVAVDVVVVVIVVAVVILVVVGIIAAASKFAVSFDTEVVGGFE